jgi:hypothetical protein
VQNEAVQLNSVTISSLWAIVQDLAMCYGPLCKIWLCAMGSNKGFGYAIWAIAPKQLPERRSYLKLAISLKGAVILKKSMYIYNNNQGLYHPSFNSQASVKKFGSPQWPIAQDEFRMRITWHTRNRILKKCSK